MAYYHLLASYFVVITKTNNERIQNKQFVFQILIEINALNKKFNMLLVLGDTVSVMVPEEFFVEMVCKIIIEGQITP